MSTKAESSAELPKDSPFARALNEAIGCNVNPGEHPECAVVLEEALKVCRQFYGYLPGETVQALQPTPIPMWLKCPYCFATHIDRDEWATRPHKTHLCEYCGIEWRPAEVYTVGIEPWDKALNP